MAVRGIGDGGGNGAPAPRALVDALPELTVPLLLVLGLLLGLLTGLVVGVPLGLILPPKIQILRSLQPRGIVVYHQVFTTKI